MSESQVAADDQEISWFWEDVEYDVRSTLTPEQRRAIEDALRKAATQSQPADFRLHLGRYFVRVIAGKERRNPDRVKDDIKNNPIFVAKNTPVIAVFWTLMLLSTLYALAFALNVFGRFVLN